MLSNNKTVNILPLNKFVVVISPRWIPTKILLLAEYNKFSPFHY